MPRLDRFLSVMREQSADAIRLTVGQPIALKTNGMVRPMTRDPLNEQQVLGLLKEIAPGAVVDRLNPGAEVAFTYDSPGGAIEVQVVPAANGVVAATLRSLFPPVARRAATAETEPDLSGPRARIDELLQTLAEDGGSDLHLKCGAPPLARKDGALVPLDQPPLDAEAIELMLRSIMSARDFGAWRQTGDADFAHEIAEVARFRGNAGRDRLGPIAVFRVIPNAIRSAEELGLSAEVQALCKLTKGLVLVTGPTGSGKSTTLAGLVDLVNRTRSDHVVTIDDPIEFVHQSRSCLITQRQVGQHTASFKTALRAALR
ncbi:MAG: type IV pilus twitching motility protein PilT, partial [Gemmatimonadales bacterium]